MGNVSNDPTRQCLKVPDWPVADQAAWNELLKPRHFLDYGPRRRPWRDATIYKYRRGYGRWLNFLAINNQLSDEGNPVDRIIRTNVLGYLSTLQEGGGAVSTIVARIYELRHVATALAPDRDWKWLSDIVSPLRAQTRKARQDPPRVVASGELVASGIRLMNEAENDPKIPERYRSLRYQDGLMLAFLAARPLRRGNFVSIQIGKNLIRQGDGYTLFFSAAETKMNRVFEIPFPKALVPYLERHIYHYRIRLLKGAESDRLWISWFGTEIRDHTVFCRITKLTRKLFGQPINPHLFRDCAATSIAIQDPAKMPVASMLLGHISPYSVERIYNQAGSLEAGRMYHQAILDLRRGD